MEASGCLYGSTVMVAFKAVYQIRFLVWISRPVFLLTFLTNIQILALWPKPWFKVIVYDHGYGHGHGQGHDHCHDYGIGYDFYA